MRGWNETQRIRSRRIVGNPELHVFLEGFMQKWLFWKGEQHICSGIYGSKCPLNFWKRPTSQLSVVRCGLSVVLVTTPGCDGALSFSNTLHHSWSGCCHQTGLGRIYPLLLFLLKIVLKVLCVTFRNSLLLVTLALMLAHSIYKVTLAKVAQTTR